MATFAAFGNRQSNWRVPWIKLWQRFGFVFLLNDEA